MECVGAAAEVPAQGSEQASAWHAPGRAPALRRCLSTKGRAVALRPQRHVTARTVTTGLAAVTLAAAGVVATSSPASAASYNGACGAGYGIATSWDITAKGGSLVGRLYLTYNTSNGYKCAVTISNLGKAVPMKAWIKRSSASTWVKDEGTYTSYAGPVYTYARGSCVDLHGYVNGASTSPGDTYCK